MTARPCDLSLVVACYNEEGHLEANVRQVVEILDRTRWSYEIIFVDDCSRDGTPQAIDRAIAEHPQKRMSKLLHTLNTGRGRTVADGFRLAQGDIVGYIDIDLEIHARHVPACVLAIRRGADAACAWRNYEFQPGSVHRYILSRGYARLVRHLLGIAPIDTESGCKFFRREKLWPLLDQVKDPGWFWDTEIMAYWTLAGHTVANIPVPFIRRKDKKSTVNLIGDSIDYLKKLWRFRTGPCQLGKATAGVPKTR